MLLIFTLRGACLPLPAEISDKPVAEEISHQTMLLFFGLVTMASGLIMPISIPVVRERKEFYQHKEMETFTLEGLFAEWVAPLKEEAFLHPFLTFLMFQRVASNYLIGLAYFYDSLIFSTRGWTGPADILIDFLEIGMGRRRPGRVRGVIGVLMTLGSAVYVFLYAQLLSAFGYDGASKVQDVISQWGIRLATGLLPAVMILVGMFFWARYPIDKRREDWVEAEMLAKHRSGQMTPLSTTE